jgi:hypothetical protein
MEQRLAQEDPGPAQSADFGQNSRAQVCDPPRHAASFRLLKMHQAPLITLRASTEAIP